MSYNFFCPTRVLFGAGQLNSLHDQKMPGKKAMVVISNGKSTRANGYLDRTVKELEAAGAATAVFDKVSSNPLKKTVEDGARFSNENSCDFVVALGGGSVMDAAKVMAMLAPQKSEDLWDYAGGTTGKNKPLEAAPLPWVAITTTAGTGSEVDSAGVISKLDTNEKIGVGGMESLFAKIAIVDPELMVSVPPKFTAYQGFDALFHSLEGYLSNQISPMGDMVQLAAVTNIAQFLPRAIKDGKDIKAREHVAFANTMSGYSMDLTGCMSEHSMEHALSAFHPELPHGAGLIMLSLEYFRHFINKKCCDDRFVTLAKALGKKDAKAADDFITALSDLQKACGVDNLKMSDYGIKKEEALKFAQNARDAMGALFRFDPAPMSQEECKTIYEKAYK